MDVEYTQAGDTVTLAYVASLMRDGMIRDYSVAGASVYFVADHNATYAATGTLAMSGDNLVVFGAALLDLSTNTYTFISTQLSDDTVDETFALGGDGGDYYNEVYGSTTGYLIGGHQYVFYWNGYIYNDDYATGPEIDEGASATSDFRLTITGDGIAEVPEPSSLVLLGTGALGLLRYRRRAERKPPAC